MATIRHVGCWLHQQRLLLDSDLLAQSTKILIVNRDYLNCSSPEVEKDSHHP